MNSDSDCEIIPDHEIKIDYKFISDHEKSLNGGNTLEYTTLLDSVTF